MFVLVLIHYCRHYLVSLTRSDGLFVPYIVITLHFYFVNVGLVMIRDCSYVSQRARCLHSDWLNRYVWFASREAGLGWVSSFNRWASVKEGLRMASYPWFEAEFSSIHRWKKEETFWLLASRELRAQTYILKNSNDRWSFGERRTKKGYSPIVWSCIFIDIRSTSTSTTASSEDALASNLRSQVACVWGRRLHARQTQRYRRPAEQSPSRKASHSFVKQR